MKLAEQNVISGLLTLEDTDYVFDFLEPQMFEDGILGKMFYLLKQANITKTPADITYLGQRLTDYPEDLVEQTIAEIVELMPMGFQLKADVNTILSDYQAREANKIVSEVSINGGNVVEKTEEMIRRLGEVVRVECKGQTLSQMVEKHKTGCFVPKENGVKIGFAEIDADLGGLEPGDLIMIGARPAVGKTAFALQVADTISKSGKKVIYFNLEMTELQIYQRMIARESGIPLYRIRTAQKFMNDEEEIRFSTANDVLAKQDNLTFVTGGQTVSEIRRSVKSQNADVVIIDYLQLLVPEGNYRGNRYAEVGQISHGLKAIARDLNIPVIVLTQLNRESEKNKTKEPTMAEIRESGDVEQDASVILLMWNTDEDDFSKKGIKLEKNRQGTKGKYKLDFMGAEMKFVTGGWEETTDEDLPFESDKE